LERDKEIAGHHCGLRIADWKASGLNQHSAIHKSAICRLGIDEMAREQHTTPLAAAYARSVLELANDQNQARQIGQELEELGKIIDSDPAFANFLANPAVSEAERGQVVEKVFRGRVSPLVMNFLLVANRKGRLGILRLIAAAYAEQLEQQMGIVEVDITVAQRLSPEQFDDVRRRVGQALKREIVLHQYVDESIIGGMVLRVQDRLLDASVRAQLQAIRRKLLSAKQK
jgi:F-type H+-transporting ATPase subunit delta